jgi:hypothetical protein
VYGNHGLPLRGEFNPQGFYASDIAVHAVGKWAPKIAIGRITQTSFLIKQMAFLEPTTAAEIIKQATRFELPDWAVWEGPAFYMNPRGERGNKWKARIGPAQLQETGPQISRLWNGVVVQYTDAAGNARTVGPPGFAGGSTETEDTLLQDSSAENPLNNSKGEAIVRKWALLTMGTSSREGAKKVGRIFLAESRQLDRSGQATLTGHVEDRNGTWWPAWMVRAGDEISFVDAAEPAYRRIVSTSYNDGGKQNQLQLEQPPDSLQALLERLSVALVPLGLS